MTLDYTLTTTEDRNAYLHNLDLTTANDHDLEICANYLLHTVDKSLCGSAQQNRSSNKKNLELDPSVEHSEIKPKKGGNYYTSPPNPVPWEHPAIADLKKGIEQLLALQEKETDSTRAYYLGRWITDARLEARLRLPIPTMSLKSSPPSSPPSIDLERNGLDWTNSFHLKHICKYYSQLRQDDEAKWDMHYFDQLVEATPLEPWQKHVLIRYIDGQNAIITARELAYDFNKAVHPGYTSVVMRSIYTKIAKTAQEQQLLTDMKNGKLEPRKCRKCGKIYPDHSFWWQKGQRQCKSCLNGWEEK